MSASSVDLRAAEAGPQRHAAGETLPRHRHRNAFVAVVLQGGYVEAGDTGRHRVGPGDILFHHAWEAHLDRFDRGGARVLVLPVADDWNGPLRGRIADPDEILRLMHTDMPAAPALLAQKVEAVRAACEDWPDILALALRDDPALSLAGWAAEQGLHPGSLSRSFSQQFGMTPAAFRATARAHRALDALRSGAETLAEVAAMCGFADQAHMTRAVAAITGFSPGRIRRGIVH